jgi:hypothetical protein
LPSELVREEVEDRQEEVEERREEVEERREEVEKSCRKDTVEEIVEHEKRKKEGEKLT